VALRVGVERRRRLVTHENPAGRRLFNDGR
jgi:hypothetical protein